MDQRKSATKRAVWNSVPTRPQYFKTQRLRSLCLSLVQSHQSLLLQFLHRREMKSIERSTMCCLRMPMLSQRRLKHCRRQMAEMKRIEVAHPDKLRLILPPLPRPDLAACRSGFELRFRLQFDERRNDDLFFRIHGETHGRALRFFAQQLEQTTRIEINHLRVPVITRSARPRASAASLREIFPLATFFCH